MSDIGPKATLQYYLDTARDALIWKLDGLSEYDVRRPLTPTGTNLLGLVKHYASVELGYLSDVFGRPSGVETPWMEPDAEDNADMWATADETRDEILDLFRRVRAHADGTIAELDLEAPGRVPWWGDDGDVTLHVILVHLVTELNRHLGHADLVRELIDGAVGLRDGNGNLPGGDAAWWSAHRDRVEEAARVAAAALPDPHSAAGDGHD